MKKRATIADKPWMVQTVVVAVPDTPARVRAAVGVLLAEIGDGPAVEQSAANGTGEQGSGRAGHRAVVPLPGTSPITSWKRL